MNWLAPGKESVVRTIILDNKTAAIIATKHWARDEIAKVRVGVWMWWTDGTCPDVGPVGPTVVCKYGREWRSCRSYQGTGRIDLSDAKRWAI